MVPIFIILAIILIVVLLEKSTGGKQGGMGCVSFAVVAFFVVWIGVECNNRSKDKTIQDAAWQLESQSLGTITNISVSTSKLGGTNMTEFPESTPEIFVCAKLVGVGPGAMLESSWYCSQSSVLPKNSFLCKSMSTSVSGNEQVWFSARKPSSNWANGDYRVEIWIRSRHLATTTFRIVPESPNVQPIVEVKPQQPIQRPQETTSQEHARNRKMWSPNN
jgi:hypothetical protein